MALTRRRMIAATIATGFPFSPVVTLAQGWEEAAAVFVGTALLQGAIAHVGGMLMTSALGEATITDVRTWIAEAVVELEAFFSAKIDQNTIEMLVSNVSGIQTNLHTYASLELKSRPANRYLIDTADVLTASSIDRLYNYPQAQEIWYTAIAYRYFEVWAHYLLDKDNGHIKAEKSFVDKFLTQALNSYNDTLKRLNPDNRIEISCAIQVVPPHIGVFPPDGGGSYSYCNVLLDGNVLDTFDDDNDARPQANAFATTVRASIQPLYDNYRNKGSQLLQSTAACYQLMCKNAGVGNYNPPVNISIEITKELFHGLNPGTIVVRPGAVVRPNQQHMDFLFKK